MQRRHAAAFRHPVHASPLELRVTGAEGDEITEGELIGGGERFPIVRGIPRFTADKNYAENFGYQWQVFAKTQLDSKSSWGRRSEKRLLEESRWPSDLSGQRILEAGSGMGRFTEPLAQMGATVFTFDYSLAVEANFANNSSFQNVSFAQGDIYFPPYEPASFDKVLCLGVIQHCPSPRRAFESLARFLRPGGEIVFDVYRLFWKSLFMGKYYLRPLTRWLPPRAQHAFVKTHMAWTYPVTSMIHQLIGLRAGRYASTLLALADFRGLDDFDEALAREMSELDTLDMLAPRYDRPQTIKTVRGWLERAGLVDIEVAPGYNGIEARGRRPE